MKNRAIPVPTEDTEQACLFRWAAMEQGRYPELAYLYHIPNEGKRGPVTAARFKALGLKSGVPDIFLPAARGGCFGLYIEMKRQAGGKLSDKQKEWIMALTSAGYSAVVCRGWEEAADVIMRYLRMRPTKEIMKSMIENGV